MIDDEVLIDDPLVPIPEGEGQIKLHLKYGGSAVTKPIQLPGGVCLTGEEYRELMAKLAEKDKAIRAAIKKLDGAGMPYRVREAIQILREARDED